jgi:myo-inositol-1(or 4)-monophosphatase
MSDPGVRREHTFGLSPGIIRLRRYITERDIWTATGAARLTRRPRTLNRRPMLHSAVVNVMIRAAHRAGRSLKRDLGEIEALQVSVKGPGNFVTAADRRAEEIVREELAKARPDYGFLGEEGGMREGGDKSHRWIVDPLDGTTNFLHGIPHFAVSIALERSGAIVAGVTYNPANDDLFVAERGKGAFLNDHRIRVAARRRLADAVVGCGLPHHGRGDLVLGRNEIFAAQQNFAGLRRYGAATLDLAWVAAGRLDAYWERDLSPWDMAAGLVLVREAGGFASDLDGGDASFAKGQIVAGNDTMHRELMRLLRDAGKQTAAASVSV